MPQQRVLLQRTIEAGGPQLAVVTDTPADVAATWRFDLHLRRRPSLPDMQDFTLPGPPNNLWIGERATDTVAGVLLLASELIDGVSEHLLDVWQQTEASPSDYPPPAAWALEPEPVASFDGITGTTSPLRPSSGHTHEQFARRLALAERILRETRSAAATP